MVDVCTDIQNSFAAEKSQQLNSRVSSYMEELEKLKSKDTSTSNERESSANEFNSLIQSFFEDKHIFSEDEGQRAVKDLMEQFYLFQ